MSPFSVALQSNPSKVPGAKETPTVYPKHITRKVRNTMDPTTNPVLKSFLAGSFSGTCSTILFQPLDLIKTRLQQSAGASSQSVVIRPPVPSSAAGVICAPGTSMAALPVQMRTLTMAGVIRDVVKDEKITGLWRGILPSVTRTVPGVGIYFGSLHWLKTNTIQSTGSEPNALQSVCMGVAARSIAATIVIPITVVKSRFECPSYGYRSMGEALTTIWRTEGFRGLTCGLAPTIIRDAPFSGLYLMFYTQLKQKVAPHFISSSSNTPPNDGTQQSAQHQRLVLSCPAPAVHFTCGLLAGFLASMVTQPADVVKTKMQLYPTKYGTVRLAVDKIWKCAGPRGFLVGLAPRMIRRTLMSALAWTVYEEIMRKAGLK